MKVLLAAVLSFSVIACSDDDNPSSDSGATDSLGTVDTTIHDSSGSDRGSRDSGSDDGTPDSSTGVDAGADSSVSDGPAADSSSSPTAKLNGRVFADDINCMQTGATVYEVGNPSNSVVSGHRGRFALYIPADKDVTVRVDGSTAGSDCLSTVRTFNLPAGPPAKEYYFDVITSKVLPHLFGGAGQAPSKALVMIKFDLPYTAAKGSETATLVSPSATGYRFHTSNGWEQGTSLFTGNNVFNTNHIFFPNVDPTPGKATFSVGPTSGSPTCVEALGATSVSTAPGTVSVVDVSCTE